MTERVASSRYPFREIESDVLETQKKELPEKVISLLPSLETIPDENMYEWIDSMVYKFPELNYQFPIERRDVHEILKEHYQLPPSLVFRLDEEVGKSKLVPYIKLKYGKNAPVKKLLVDERGLLAYAALSQNLRARFSLRKGLRLKGLQDEKRSLLGEQAFEALFAESNEVVYREPINPRKEEDISTNVNEEITFQEERFQTRIFIPELDSQVIKEELTDWTPQMLDSMSKLLVSGDITPDSVVSREVYAALEFSYHYMHRLVLSYEGYAPYQGQNNIDIQSLIKKMGDVAEFMSEMQRNKYKVESLKDVYQGFRKAAIEEGMKLEETK